jgi:hypothetical protein
MSRWTRWPAATPRGPDPGVPEVFAENGMWVADFRSPQPNLLPDIGICQLLHYPCKTLL